MMARKAQGQSHAGLWEFPGGKVEIQECPTAALKREIWEELGVVIEVVEQVAVVNHGDIEMTAYRASIVSGILELREHDSLEWLLPEQMDGMPMAELDRKVRQFL